MREHMRADVPFGLFLSGGVDSSLLCAMLTQMHDRPIESFSVGYSVNRERNELDDAQKIAQRFGTRHHALEITPDEVLARIPHAIWSTDELMRDFAVLPTSLLAEKAGQSLKVIFTGEGGDEAFAGYARYRKRPFQRWLSNLMRPGTGGFRARNRWPADLRQRCYSPQLQAASNGFRRVQVEAWRDAPPAWSDLQRIQYYDLIAALPDKLLVKVDRSLMAWGVEARVPYLDHRIVEFGLGLPDALKVQGRMGKVLPARVGPAPHPGAVPDAVEEGLSRADAADPARRVPDTAGPGAGGQRSHPQLVQGRRRQGPDRGAAAHRWPQRSGLGAAAVCDLAPPLRRAAGAQARSAARTRWTGSAEGPPPKEGPHRDRPLADSRRGARFPESVPARHVVGPNPPRRSIMFRILAALILAAFAFAAQAAVDANKANQAELETVKGIGPGLSSKILDARKAAAFKDWNDLVERVGGVGPGNAAKFSQAGLTVNDVAYSAAPAPAADKPARKTAKEADAAPAKRP